jgi:hypothetical protein
MALFLKIMQPSEEDSILDLGGTAFNWLLIGYKHKVTLLNLTTPNQLTEANNISFVIGDATDLQYKNGEYDICFSNSVIEHVGSIEKQKMFAYEACRVGKRIWIQTPAKSFFFEPHYITPFIHWLPKDYQKKLLRNFSIWGLITRPSQEYVDEFVDQTRLLTLKEVIDLFPGCTVIKEKFLFMTKAYLIVRD